MKKIYAFLVLLLISGVIFAQYEKSNQGILSSIPVLKEINNIPSDGSKPVVDSLNYDGANGNSIGTNAAATFGVYAYWPQASLASHVTANHKFLSLKVYINIGTATLSNCQVRIYSGQGTGLLYSQAFTPIQGWNNIIFTTPFTIPTTGNLYVGYNFTTTGGYPAGCDLGPVNPNGNWIDFNGTWQHLTDLAATLTYNWNIRIMCGTPAASPVATCTPLSWNAGNVPTATSVTSGTFTLTNTGAGTLTCSGISGVSAPFTTTFAPASVNLATGASYTFTFSYSPTVVGPNNQTAVITTNGGTVNISLSGAGVNCSPISTFPWIESFEGASFPPACWTKNSPDGGTGWASITSGTTPLPGFNGGTMTVPAGGGTKAAYVSWNTGGASSNNQWLISPAINVPVNALLGFHIFWFGSYQDFLDVKLSTTTNAVASFTNTLLALDTLQLIHNDWKQFNIPLSAYTGQNVYIGFNEHVANNTVDGAFLAIDLVRVDITTGVEQVVEEMVNIYPNPANDKVYIAASNVKSVEVYNLIGNKVASYNNVNIINTSDYSEGFYFIKVVTAGKNITKKIHIVH